MDIYSMDTEKVKSVFKYAEWFNNETLKHIYTNIYGLTPNDLLKNLVLEKPKDMFESICNCVDKILKLALMPLGGVAGLEKNCRYKYENLRILTVYHVIYLLMRQFHSSINADVTEKIHTYNSEEKIYRDKRRIEKLSELNNERNDEHLRYFNIQEKYNMYLSSIDTYYYEILGDDKLFRNFLYSEDDKLDGRIISQICDIYDKCEKELWGFDRFAVEYRIENDTHLDLILNMINILCNELDKKAINKEYIAQMLPYIGNCCHFNWFKIIDSFKEPIPKETAIHSYAYDIRNYLDSLDRHESANVYIAYYYYLRLEQEYVESIKSKYEQTNNSSDDSEAQKFLNDPGRAENICQQMMYNSYFNIKNNNFISIGLDGIYDFIRASKNYDIIAARNILCKLNALLFASSHCVASSLSIIFIARLWKKYGLERVNKISLKDKKKYSDDIIELIEDVAQSDLCANFFDDFFKKQKLRPNYQLIRKMNPRSNLCKFANIIYKIK